MMQSKCASNSLRLKILVGAILATLLGSTSTSVQAAELSPGTNPVGAEQAILENASSESCMEDGVLVREDDIKALSAEPSAAQLTGQPEDINLDSFVQAQEAVCAVGGGGVAAPAVGGGAVPTVASGGGFPYELLGLAGLPLLALAPSLGFDESSSGPEPIPEPSTILGSGIALGFGFLFHRSYSRRLKNNS